MVKVDSGGNLYPSMMITVAHELKLFQPNEDLSFSYVNMILPIANVRKKLPEPP